VIGIDARANDAFSFGVRARVLVCPTDLFCGSAEALRIVDASKRRLPLQKKIGAGMSVEEFRGQVAAGVIKHVGLPESVAMVADSLNLPVDQITETIEPVVARERVQTEFLTVEAGQAAGVLAACPARCASRVQSRRGVGA